MADIITRLLLKTNDFDANLNKAKGSVNSFQGGVSNMAATAGAGVMKFAGAIGLAAGAYETFDKLIHSSQGTQDAFEWRMAACKETVDMFFYSLSSGDFTAFNQGIDSTYNNLVRLQQLRDDYADAKISNNVFRAQYQTASLQLKAIIGDNTSTKSEKSKAATDLKKITEAYSKQLNSTNDINVSQMIQNAQTKTGRYYSKDDIVRFFKVYNNPASLDDKKGDFDSYAAKMSDLKKKESHYEAVEVGAGKSKAVVMQKVVNPEVTKQIQQLQKENNELDRMYILSQHNDKTWSELSSSVIEYFGAQGEAAQNLNFLIKQENKAGKAGGSGGKKEDDPLSGSLAWFDSELAKKNKELSTATTMQARAAVQQTINELEQQKVNLKIVIQQEVFKIEHGEMKDGSLPGPVRPSGAIEKFDTAGIKLPKFEPFINKKDLEANEEFARSLTGIAAGFGVLGQAAGQFGEDGLSFALNSIGAIAQMITSLEALATAQGVASAFALPFPASLGAIATVIGTITSIFSSLPAFANGGVVPGGSFTGDKVHALVNSGEMILNGGQQSNLFRLLNGGIPSAERVNIGPQIRRIAALITPTADSRRIEVSGNVRVRGRDLDLALRNNDKITSKIR